MGHTLWVLDETSESDDWDHSLILSFETELNQLSQQLGFKALNEYFDHSILAEEFGQQADPNYLTATDIELVITKLLEAIQQGVSPKLAQAQELKEELEDCLTKIKAIGAKQQKVRLSLVP